MFIFDLTIADWMTLSGHGLVWFALWCAIDWKIEYSISALLVAMLIDALDGKVARKLNVARPFGRYLGSFVDLLNYTVVPPLILWRLGFKGPDAQIVLWIYSTCGLLRLSKFNEIGNIEQNGELAYLGLPVFWVHFVLMGLYFVWWVGDPMAFRLTTSISLLALGFCFVLNRPFWKPQNYAVIGVVSLVCAAGFAAFGRWKP